VLNGPPKWPIFDIAGALAPEVRVDPEVAAWLEEFLVTHVGGIETENVCRAAVRWATLRDTPGVRLPDLPDPFEPLILMYERGGEVIIDDSRAFNFANIRVQINLWREHLSAEPATALDPDILDALDRGRPARPPAATGRPGITGALASGTDMRRTAPRSTSPRSP
jgi:hypothetical protein